MPFDGQLAYVVNRATETSVPLDLAAALARYGDCEADVVSYYGDGESERRNVVVRSVGNGSRLDPSGYASLRSVLEAYDVVQVHHHFSGILARVLASVDGPTVVSRIGNVWRGFSPLARTLEGLTRPLCDRVVCNSRAVLRSLPAWERRLTGSERYRVIPNGFDERAVAENLAAEPELPHEDAIDGGDVVLSTASVMTEQKDLQTLVRAIAALDDERRGRLTVLLAGDGPRRSALEALVAEHDLASTVTFLGMLDRPQVHRLLQRSDVFAMPSRWEGFSAASLEAMGIGTACLFSRIEPFTWPYDGYALFHEPSNPRDLAAKLTRYLDDPQLRARTASAAREHVLETFHVAETVREYLDLYEELHGQ